MDDVRKRVKRAINWLIFQEKAENERALAELLGYTKSSFSQIVNGRVPLSDKFLKALCSLDDNINCVWIKTGEGDMFSNGSGVTQKVYGDNNNVAGRDVNSPNEDMGKLIDTISSQQKSISALVDSNHSLVMRIVGMSDRNNQ